MGKGSSAPGKGALLLLGLLLAVCACAGLGQGQKSVATGQRTPGATPVSLTALHWCGSPLIAFEDKQQSPPRIVRDWAAVAPALGLTVYLPKSLPAGSCLVSVDGSIHDAELGDHFSIDYLLPNQSPLSFLESPLTGASLPFQCQATEQPGASLICTGSLGQTRVLIAAKETQAQLHALFNAMAAGVAWQPTS